jgi:hypothetical protein
MRRLIAASDKREIMVPARRPRSQLGEGSFVESTPDPLFSQNENLLATLAR